MAEKTPEQARAAVRQRDQRHRLLFEAANDAIFVMDRGVSVECNRRAAEMFGGTVEQMLGVGPYDLSPPTQPDGRDSPSKALERMQAVHAGEPQMFEWRHCRFDGTQFDAEVSLNCIGPPEEQRVLAVVRDITQRKRAEDALRREHDLVSRIAETSPMGISVVDRDGQIVFANAHLERVLGIGQEEITSRRYDAAAWRITDYEGGAFAADQLPFQQVRRTGKAVGDVRHAIEWPDGRRRLLSINAAPLFDEAGRFDGMVASIEDVTERIRAEAQIRQERDKAERYLNMSGTILVAIDVDQNVTLINEKGCEILGRSREEIIGRNWFDDCLPPDVAAPVKAVNEKLMAGNIENVEYYENPVLTAAGERRLIAWHNVLMHDEQGQIIGTLSSGEDITERKKVEQALRASEAYQRAIFRAAPVGIGVVVDRVITQVNERFCEMLDYSREELIGQNARMVYPTQEDYEYVGEVKYDQIREKGTGTVITRMLRKDGQIIDVLLSSSRLDPNEVSTGVTFTALDITERLGAERALRESEEKFRKAFQTSPDAICIGTMDGTFVDVNEGFIALTGYAREEAIGRSSEELGLWVSPEARRRFFESLGRNARVDNLETEFRIKDGSARTALISANVIDLGGAPHVLTITRDISERQSLLNQARRDAEIKQNLLGELNHRVKNNLATMTSLMYLERVHPTQTKEQFIQSCLTRITSLAELHSLLSQQPDGSIQAATLVHRVASATVSGALPPLPKLSFDIDAEDLELDTNMAGGLAMALSELVANALRHGLPRAEWPELGVSLQCADGVWRLEVVDNGAGLPAGFDAARDGGTGLKLVRQIAQKQLHGALHFERRSDRTVASISFILPHSGR